MDWIAYEEMEYHWNAQFDYQAELAREAMDFVQDEIDEYEAELGDDWAPQHDSHVKEWYLHTDYVPF